MVATMAISATPTPTLSSAIPVSSATAIPTPPVTATTKKCPPNIRTGSVHPPVLVSPISVAHGNAMLGVDGTKKGSGGANWMRDQWVANLKKKRMGGGSSTSGAGNDGSVVATASVGPAPPTVKAGVRAEKTTAGRAKRSNKKTNNNTNNSTASNANATTTSGITATTTTTTTNQHIVNTSLDKDSLSLMNPALFFNDLGCFELESPSFMRLTPTAFGGLDGTSGGGAFPSPAAATSSGKTDKKWMKPLMKKRSSCFSAELNSEPKRRTPRRPNAAAGTFDDQSDYYSSSPPHSYSSVGTPSNFHHHSTNSSSSIHSHGHGGAEVSRMWGPELDLSNGYVDTFLDLPTPKSAEMPQVSMARTPSSSSSRTHELEQPKLIRTTSIEQEGLSHFFEQTTLRGGDDSNGNTNGDASSHQSSKSQPQSYTGAAANTVDEYFGKMALPSPSAHYGRYLQSTPKGTTPTVRGPNHHSQPHSLSHHAHYASSDYSFDPQHHHHHSHHHHAPQKTSSSSHSHGKMPPSSAEFDSLAHEYEFTDFDQELDSFYLDTIESFGGELDLISN